MGYSEFCQRHLVKLNAKYTVCNYIYVCVCVCVCVCMCVCVSVQAYQAGRGSLVCQSDEEIIRGVAVKSVPPPHPRAVSSRWVLTWQIPL